jgi:hypothetical protein
MFLVFAPPKKTLRMANYLIYNLLGLQHDDGHLFPNGQQKA